MRDADRRSAEYLHLQVAGRSQGLSGSSGTSADRERKFVSDRAASHVSLGCDDLRAAVLHPYLPFDHDHPERASFIFLPDLILTQRRILVGHEAT